jgi:pyruvate-formate lyase
LVYSTSARLQAYGFSQLKFNFVCIAKDTIFTFYNNLKQNNMTTIANLTDSFTEQLRFLHKQSLACLRMIEIAEDQIERDRWISEYTDNQIELMNLQQVNHAL